MSDRAVERLIAALFLIVGVFVLVDCVMVWTGAAAVFAIVGLIYVATGVDLWHWTTKRGQP